MKTKALKIFHLGLILLVPIFGGCQENETPLEPGSTVSLDRIPENPDYQSLPLVGTRWKLIGFVNSKLEIIKLVEPDSDSNYILVFSEDGNIQGQTSTNTANGKYSLSNNSLSISNFTNSTEINELFDGLSYIKAMNMVNSYDITSKGLKLIYDQDKHLLFKPIK
jgi:heat shock protein HslJ